MFSFITFLSLISLGLIGMAITRNCIFERSSIAGSGGVASGTLAAYGGRIWMRQGLKNAEEGDEVNWRSDLVVEITKTVAADVIADAVDVQVDLATGLEVSAGGTIVGAARGGSANGDLTVLVALNEQGSGGGVLAVAQQALAGAGAINVTSYYTAWTSTGVDAATLADGVVPGQRKKLQLIVDGGTGTLTPVTLSGGTTITFADAGDFAELVWTGSTWVVVELGNDTDGATAPVLA